LPVKAQTKQTETLVAIRTSKDVGEDVPHTGRSTLGSEAKDVEATEEREYIRWDDLKDEHSGECSPKESHSFAVRSSVQVQSYYPDVNCFHTRMGGLEYLAKWKQSADSKTCLSWVGSTREGIERTLQ
jgi:hypothetical protein